MNENNLTLEEKTENVKKELEKYVLSKKKSADVLMKYESLSEVFMMSKEEAFIFTVLGDFEMVSNDNEEAFLKLNKAKFLKVKRDLVKTDEVWLKLTIDYLEKNKGRYMGYREITAFVIKTLNLPVIVVNRSYKEKVCYDELAYHSYSATRVRSILSKNNGILFTNNYFAKGWTLI